MALLNFLDGYVDYIVTQLTYCTGYFVACLFLFFYSFLGTLFFHVDNHFKVIKKAW